MPDGFWDGLKVRLEENPLLLVYAGAAGLAFMLVIIVIVFLFATGGGDGDEDIVSGSPSPTTSGSPSIQPSGTLATPTPTQSGDLPSVEDVAPELTFLGDLAVINSRPVTTTFDSSTDSIDLPDGSTLEVPTGAFSAPTDVTVSIVDLAYEAFFLTPPDGRIYIISAGEDITLGAPLVLEIDKPSGSVIAGEYAGGSWSDVGVGGGETTRIELGPVSNRTIGVSDETSTNPLHLREQTFLQNDVAASLLRDCIDTMAYLLGVPQDPTGVVIGVAFEACAQAIDDAASSSDDVSLECLSDLLDNGVDADDAIDECLAQERTPTPLATPSPSPQPTQPPTAPPTPTKAPVSGILAPGVLSSSAAIDGDCTQPSEDANITCSYDISVTMDYQVSELPARIRCAIQTQVPNFSPVSTGTAQLNSESATVTVVAEATAQFDADGDPLFSSPTLVSCQLQRPIGAGEFNDLDSILVDVALPGPNI